MDNSNVDLSEVAKFSNLASHWWDTEGELKSLHDINPLRLAFINEHAPLQTKQVIDIGCGGGILAESMALAGALVTGIDASDEAIKVAQLRQLETKTTIDYVVTTAEAMAIQHPQHFDVVTCLEMLEHVPDPCSVVKACADLLKPGGHLFFSTLNRNLKSYLFSIIGAEYILKLLPRNTHDFAKFIKPAELSLWARQAGLLTQHMAGISYNPFTKNYTLSSDYSVNYLIHLQKKR
jgi:2-polyprenyl-6-hydroxyphenyl methylase/3-demethylubiquinone-9 3-methyltransferase